MVAVSRLEPRLLEALESCGPKADDVEPQSTKKNFNQNVSDALAIALASEMRDRGMGGVLPLPRDPRTGHSGGTERRMAGGIGAKKVDVTWATDEAGLIAAISVKTHSLS